MRFSGWCQPVSPAQTSLTSSTTAAAATATSPSSTTTTTTTTATTTTTTAAGFVSPEAVCCVADASLGHNNVNADNGSDGQLKEPDHSGEKWLNRTQVLRVVRNLKMRSIL